MNRGGEKSSEWRRMFLYSRCVCFGCAGNDHQMTNIADDDSASNSSIQENNSFYNRKAKAKKKKAKSDTKLDTSTMPAEVVQVDGVYRPMLLANDIKILTDKTRQHNNVNVKSRRKLSSTKYELLPNVTSLKIKHLALMSTSKDVDLHYLTQAFRILNSSDRWTFNIFTLNKVTNGRSLFYMALHLFHQYDFLRTFNLDIIRLMRCFNLIESCYYFSNPYHNSVHAADVVQAMHCQLQETQMVRYLKPVEKMAAILSAACHDVDHPGTNQGFLIATSNPLTALYHNLSVLENHHWRTTIGILHESKLFEHLDRPTWLRMKNLIQTMVLATDITQQAQILSRFRGYLDGNGLDLSSDEQHRAFILELTLKCADISNPCRPWKMSKCWSELICEEFFKQGDNERQLGLLVTPFCDRYQTTMAKIQTGFMTHVAEPLFLEWNRFLGSSNSIAMLENLRYNRNQWDSITLQDNKITVHAIAEAERDEQEPDQDQQDCKENDDPTPDGKLEKLDLIESGTTPQRRHSHPYAGINPHQQRTSLTGRRLSLPNGYNGFTSPLISTLERLPECSQTSEEPVQKSKIRRRSLNLHGVGYDNDALIQHDVENAKTHLFDHTINCPLNAHMYRNADLGGSNGKGTSNHDLLPTDNQLDPDAEFCHRWHNGTRKLSLIPFPDHQAKATIVGRKRSRSLVSTILTCALTENKNWNNNLNGQLPIEHIVESGSWLSWWNKKAKNHISTTKIRSLVTPSDENCCHTAGVNGTDEDLGSTGGDGSGHVVSPVQLLRCQCPVLVTRFVQSSRAGDTTTTTTRKPTSVFTPSTAAKDAETVPLLASDSNCLWHNEV